MPAPVPILSLIERFEFHRQAYILGNYNETQLRREFVDKFFSALGWDVDNNKGFSEKFKEVLHEEPVRIRGTTLFFDYTFRVGGTRKFIVETKKPSVRIKDAAEAALQLRRYAWNQKLPLSILTNFEEFAIYDCRVKPENGDAASKARIEYFTYKEYPEKWDWLVSIISPESIQRGSFDKYAETMKGKRGTATVDDDILAEIEQWRDALAKNIALRNPSLTVEELNSVVQRTIDRILFLRICEDRGIEEYETLHKLLEGEQVYERICQLFRYADDKYNSGLFHFQQEPDWDESPDTLSLTIAIDDKILKGIIKRLYFPDSQYEFSLIPPAILGHVYEQFLGKVIRLTEGHQAKVEYKPEVKKAGGVFYTPQYIVEYIVKHTVGELVKDKMPREVSKLRILDPACGSGSFLIGAYQYLLDWHRDWYIAHLVPVFKEKNSVTDPAVLALLPEQAPKKKKSAATIDLPIYNPGNGKDVRLSERVRSDWKLTTAEKKRILLNNIFGVDIDQQAVEVTKLSLLLKVLEEENQETVSKQLTITAERALPSLDHNIKCGNSLIGWDILTPEMPADEVKRINPFDWLKEFEPVMAAGGFDAVIGNPPYLRIQGLQEYYGNQIDYFIKNYHSAIKRFDLYLLFFEKGCVLLKKDGYLSYITPHKFLNSDFGSGLRNFLVQKKLLKNFISFGHIPVFQNATTYTGISLLQNRINDIFGYYEFDDNTDGDMRISLKHLENIPFNRYDILKFSEKPWQLTNTNKNGVLIKITSQPKVLKDSFAEIFQGVVTGADDIYFLLKSADQTESNEILTVFSEKVDKTISIEKGILKPMLKGEEIHQYSELDFKYYCIYPYKFENGKTTILEEDEFSSKFPLAFEYLSKFRTDLKNLRIKFKTNPKYWYSCHRGRSIELFEKERIVTPEISLGCNMTLCSNGLYHNTKVYSLLPEEKVSENIRYYLGILNSKIMWWYLSNTGYALRGGYFTFKTNYLKDFPLRTINPNDPTDIARHDRMVSLVTQMLDLNKKLRDARLEQERTMLSRQVEATDAAIDKLVYELYGLTEEEIAIVEGSGK
jgi:type I restriction-modification system DNA methylase subunit